MLIKQLYDLMSFQRFIDQKSHQFAKFADSDSGIVLARNLTAIDPKIFEKKFPELAFVNSGIMTDNSGGYVDLIQSLRILELGDFKDASDDADNKGKISLAGEDNFIKVFGKTANSKWTDDDIKKAELQGINLPQSYIAAHTKKFQQKVDSIGLLGQGAQKGLLNQAGWTATAATAPIATATSQELYDDISGLINAQWNGVLNVPEYKANRVMMPTDVLNKLQSAILNTAAGSSSVLKALQDNFPGIEFISSVKADSVGGTTKTVAFSNHDEAMKMRIPEPLNIGEIIRVGSFDFSVDSKFRIGGLDVLEELSGRYVTGL